MLGKRASNGAVLYPLILSSIASAILDQNLGGRFTTVNKYTVKSTHRNQHTAQDKPVISHYACHQDLLTSFIFINSGLAPKIFLSKYPTTALPKTDRQTNETVLPKTPEDSFTEQLDFSENESHLEVV